MVQEYHLILFNNSSDSSDSSDFSDNSDSCYQQTFSANIFFQHTFFPNGNLPAASQLQMF